MVEVVLVETGEKRDRSHDDAMAEQLKEDQAFAAEYLNQLLQDGEPSDLLIALRQMAQAYFTPVVIGLS